MKWSNVVYGEFVGGRGAVGLLVLRIVAGLGFMFHGWGKIQNPFGWMGPDAFAPGFLQALAALSEFAGSEAYSARAAFRRARRNRAWLAASASSLAAAASDHGVPC